MTRDYRIVAKLKNNRLWEAIRLMWPEVTTQAEAARRLNITPSEIGYLLNMTRYPNGQHGWWRLALKIADALRETPDYLFDRELYGLKPDPLDITFDRPALEDFRRLMLPPVQPDQILESTENDAAIRAILNTLTPREQAVLERRYGFDGPEQTQEEIGIEFKIGKGRVSQIESKGLSKLRYGIRNKKLRKATGMVSGI